MANGVAPTLETLSAIVEGHSRQFTTLHEEVANVAQRQETLFGQLSTQITEQRREAEAERRATDAQQRSDNAQQIAALASNRPDYKGLLAASAGVAAVFVSVFVTIGSMALSPIRESEADIKAQVTKNQSEQHEQAKEIQDLQQRRNLAMEAATTKVSDDLVKARIELATLTGLEVERHEVYLKDDARHESRENAIDGALIKRPEIEGMVGALTDHIKSDALSLNDRITSVIGSLNELRHDVGTNYTTGDALKSAFDRMDKFQTQLNALSAAASQAPMRAAPSAPAPGGDR